MTAATLSPCTKSQSGKRNPGAQASRLRVRITASGTLASFEKEAGFQPAFFLHAGGTPALPGFSHTQAGRLRSRGFLTRRRDACAPGVFSHAGGTPALPGFSYTQAGRLRSRGFLTRRRPACAPGGVHPG